MSTLSEIQSAIVKLPPREQAKLRDWTLAQIPEAPSAFHALRELAGAAGDLPEDLAENHDHYIHGTPKRVQR